jgi:zinc protease
VTARQIGGFHSKWARADNLVVSVVGCADVDRVAARVEALFGGMRRDQYACDYAMPPLPIGIEKIDISCGREQSRLILAMLTQGGLSEDRFALMHAAEILGGSGGRLFTALRERSGVVYDVDATFSTAPEFGVFSVELTTDPQKLSEAQSHVYIEMERFATEGPSAEELMSVAAKFAHSFSSRRQRASSRAGDFALWERIYGGGFQVEELEMSAISRVTREQVQRVMRRLMEQSSGVQLSTRPV